MPTVSDQIVNVWDHVWDDNTLAWVPETQPTAGVGGTSDATAANQALEIAALGGTTDAEATGNGSILAILKRIRTLLASPLSVTVSNASLAVTGTFYPTTAGSPLSARLSDGSAFYKATTPSDTQPVSGTFYQVTQPVSIASMPSTPVTGTFFQTTQPVSLAALPALAAGSAVIGHVIVDTAPTTAVTGPLTDTQLRASAVPVSAATLPLPSNAAIETGGNLASLVAKDFATTAKQDTGNTSLSSIDTKLTSQATGAKQDTGNTSLGTIKTNTDPLVVAAAGGYVRQDSTATIAKESGGNLATLAAVDFATAAKQTTGNSSLATIATNTAPLVYAQAAAGASLVGPMVQGLVNDTPDTYIAGVIQPLSLTPEGRLRVSSVPSSINQVWQETFSANPWGETDDSLWGAFPSAAQSAMSFAGES